MISAFCLGPARPSSALLAGERKGAVDPGQGWYSTNCVNLRLVQRTRLEGNRDLHNYNVHEIWHTAMSSVMPYRASDEAAECAQRKTTPGKDMLIFWTSIDGAASYLAPQFAFGLHVLSHDHGGALTGHGSVSVCNVKSKMAQERRWRKQRDGDALVHKAPASDVTLPLDIEGGVGQVDLEVPE